MSGFDHLKAMYARYVKGFYKEAENCSEWCADCPHNDTCEFSGGPMSYEEWLEGYKDEKCTEREE